MPSESLPSPSRLVCGDVPGTVRSWYHSQACLPGTLVLCLPQISVLSAGHRHMEPLQDVPFTVPRPVLEDGMSASICSSPCALEHERDTCVCVRVCLSLCVCVCVCRRRVPLDGVCESAQRLLSPGTAAVSQRAGSGGLHLHAGADRSQTAAREQRRLHHVSACGSAAGAPQVLQPSGTAAFPISPLLAPSKYRNMHIYIYICVRDRIQTSDICCCYWLIYVTLEHKTTVIRILF